MITTIMYASYIYIYINTQEIIGSKYCTMSCIIIKIYIINKINILLKQIKFDYDLFYITKKSDIT